MYQLVIKSTNSFSVPAGFFAQADILPPRLFGGCKHHLPRNPEQLASMRETGQQDQACNDDSRQVDGKKGRVHARDLRSGGSDRRMEKFRTREKFRTDYCAGMTICS